MNLYEALIKELPRIAGAVKHLPPNLAERAFDALVDMLRRSHDEDDDVDTDDDTGMVTAVPHQMTMDVPSHWEPGGRKISPDGHLPGQRGTDE